MENRILLIGDGGHCKSVIDTLLRNNTYDEIGVISKENKNKKILGVDIVGTDDNLISLFNGGWTNAFITVGSVGDTTIRKNIYKKLIEIGFKVPNIIDKSSIVSESAIFGEGIFVGKGAIINANTTVNSCSIINSGSVIEHDCSIGQFVHISSNSTVCGNVTIGNDVHVGAGSVIKQGLDIGKNSLIGIGSVVTKSIENNVVAYGNPCKVIRKK